MVPEIGFCFDYNFDYWWIGEGQDAFDLHWSDSSEDGSITDPAIGFRAVSQDTLEAELAAWTERGETVFDTNDYA